MDSTQHWENVYQTKSSTDVSWYEPDPVQSLDLILQVAGEARGRVLDVGGGQSFLVDRLLDAGFEQVSVLDISNAAIDATKLRLGSRSDNVKWIVSDITQANSLGEFDIWHDRAVLHFLTNLDEQRRYVELLRETLPFGGYLIVGAFAKGGPEKCSGLQVRQYDETTMRNLLGSDFEHIQSLDYLHTTPAGKTQQFYYGIFRRT
jgi:SAM-dependent methyltransferase